MPWTDDVAYLAAVSRSVYGAMAAVDPGAVWLVQGWTLHNRPDFWKEPQAKAFLGEGRIVVLDFYAEGDPGWLKTEGWWGTPWIWCLLHDMGQNYGMYGKFDTMAAAPLAAAAANATMIGQGMVPEGYEQNPNIYEFFSEGAFVVSNEISELHACCTKPFGCSGDTPRRCNSLSSPLLVSALISVHAAADTARPGGLVGRLLHAPAARAAAERRGRLGSPLHLQRLQLQGWPRES